MDIRFPKTTTEQLNKFISSRQELYKQYIPTFEKHQKVIHEINDLLTSIYSSSAHKYENHSFYFTDNRDLDMAIDCTKWRLSIFAILSGAFAVASCVFMFIDWNWVFACGLTLFVLLLFTWCSYIYYNACVKLQSKFEKSRKACTLYLKELFGKNFDPNNPNDLDLYSYFFDHNAREAERLHSELMTLEKLQKIDNLKLSHIDDNVPCFVETVNGVKYIRKAKRMTDEELQYATSKKTVFDFSYIDEFFAEYLNMI